MKTSRQINAERKAVGLPPLNFRLFRKVIKKLETAPEAYDQSDDAHKSARSPCGTRACIGGWADLLSGSAESEKSVRLERAGNTLGLDGSYHDAGTEKSVLFNGRPAAQDHDRWPQPYADQWRLAKGVRGQARVAIRYLTHIVKTGKVLE